MDDAASANFPMLVSREQAGNAIGKALRLFVGRGRQFSVKQLSNGTGVKDRIIECALCDAGSVDYRPLPPEALISIMRFLGAAFTSEWIGLADQGAFDLPDADGPRPGEIAADSCDDTARLTRAAMDGVYDESEKPDVRHIGTRMMARGAHLVALATAA